MSQVGRRRTANQRFGGDRFRPVNTEQLVQQTKAILQAKAVLELDTPIELASGQMSKHFVDGKAGLAEADDLRIACSAMHAIIAAAGIDYDAVGGPTLGADHLCVGMSLVGGADWYIVRKEPKGRGTGKQIEGASLGAASRVVVVEDVISTGGSLLKALDVIEATGATIVACTALIDRGDSCRPALDARGIPFLPVANYADFGMDPVLPPGEL